MENSSSMHHPLYNGKSDEECGDQSQGPKNQLPNCLVAILLQFKLAPPIIQDYENATIQDAHLQSIQLLLKDERWQTSMTCSL